MSEYNNNLNKLIKHYRDIAFNNKRIEKAKEGVIWFGGNWCIINEKCFIWKK